MCIKSSNSNSITLYSYGALTAESVSPAAAGAYVGPFTATFNFGRIYFGPEGVFTNPTCALGGPATNPLVPLTSWSITPGWTAPSAVLGQVPHPTLQGSIGTCAGTTGTYTRVSDAYVLTASGSCTVSGVTGLNSNFVFSGHQAPCLGDFTGVDNCGPTTLPTNPDLNDAEFVGAYTQAP